MTGFGVKNNVFELKTLDSYNSPPLGVGTSCMDTMFSGTRSSAFWGCQEIFAMHEWFWVKKQRF